MFDLSLDKLLVIAFVAVTLVGPRRLPQYAAGFARFIRTVRNAADLATQRMKEELGPEVTEIQWQKLDPRRYDPRRIIRDALVEGPDANPQQENRRQEGGNVEEPLASKRLPGEDEPH